MVNDDVRLLAKGAGVALWEIADHIGVSEATLTRMLRKVLDPVGRERLVNAIVAIKEGRNNNDR